MKSKLVRWGAVALMIGTLAGCGGGSSGDGGGTTATTTTTTLPTTGGGTNPVLTINANTMTADQWSALKPFATVTSVVVNGAPVVKFKVTDDKGTPIVGLGGQSKSSTALVSTNYNISFTLAKLVTGTNGAPSKWVSYIVTKPGTVAAPATLGTFPAADTQGTMVDNGDGTYQYTFYRDVTKVKDVVAGLTDSGLNLKADLGDVTFEPTLTHRLGMFIAGSQPGTGAATPNAVTDPAKPAVALVNTFNLGYDFVPNGGAVTSTRDIVVKASCTECHAGRGIGHISATASIGNLVGRNDPRLCVTCHTDQTKYGFPEAKTTATGYDDTDPNGYKRVNGESAFTYPRMIHQTHMGNRLTKTGYNLNAHAADASGKKICGPTTVTNTAQCYNLVAFPQEMNCTKCHDGSATATNKTANGDNWKTVPSRLACGACHDGINWATGKGIAVGNVGLAVGGHAGGAQSSDASCTQCHGAADVVLFHATNNQTAHNPTVPAGLKIIKYEVKSADATASNVKVVFKITVDGAPVTFLAAAAGMANPLTGFTGSPGFLLAYAQAQDGIASPVDFNNLSTGLSNSQPASVSIANLLDTAKALTSGTLAGPDSSGYYTATIVGAANIFPAGATLRTVALQGSFSQITDPGTSAAPVARQALSVVKNVTGDAARRSVIDPNKCGNCHEWFIGHGGSRIIGLGSSGTPVCLMCHNPNLKTSGRGISDAVLLAYPFTASDNAILTEWGFDKTKTNAALGFAQTSNDFKDMIHGIHAADDRTNPIRIVRDRTPSAITLINGSEILFPGLLKNCQACHIPGTYSGVPDNTLVSTQEADNGVFLNGVSRTTADAKAALKQPNPQDKVTTPFTAACVSCHDKAAAKGHMSSNGGQILVARSAQNTAGETCAVCHGAGKDFDPAKVHQ